MKIFILSLILLLFCGGCRHQLESVDENIYIISITVVGEVNKPGKISLKGGVSVMQAIDECGGFTGYQGNVRVMRNKEAILVKKDKLRSFLLIEGDLLVVMMD